MSASTGDLSSGQQRADMSITRLLADTQLFGNLAPDDLAACAARFREVHFEKGELLFGRGDPGTSLYLLADGQVRLATATAGGRELSFQVAVTGDIFGEIALLDGGARTADAFALTNCELMVIDRRDFVPLVSQHPEIALKLIEILCRRIRRTSEQVEDVTFLDLPGRLAKTLLRLSADSGAQSRKVSITQREIGQMIGMSRESTNKQLREWEENKWVKLERGGVIVLDRRPLMEIVSAADEGLD